MPPRAVFGELGLDTMALGYVALETSAEQFLPGAIGQGCSCTNREHDDGFGDPWGI